LEIDEHLNTAHIFLLLISPDFIGSDYYDVEMKKVLERHEKKEARVIPIILRPIDWKKAKFNKLQFLPRDEKPVTQWQDPEESLFRIAKEISSVIDNLVAREWLNYGIVLQELKYYEKALCAFENAIKYDPGDVEAYNRMGDTHYAQHNDEEALKVYESARRYDPTSIWAWYGIGNVYLRQKIMRLLLMLFKKSR
jgi:tetratricopeptide (TPR) repeat protein